MSAENTASEAIIAVREEAIESLREQNELELTRQHGEATYRAARMDLDERGLVLFARAAALQAAAQINSTDPATTVRERADLFEAWMNR